MPEIADRIISSVEEGNFFVALIIVAIAVLFNYKKIASYLMDRKKARLAAISEALSCDHLDEPTKDYLQEELVTEHFKVTIGIRMERRIREMVLNLYARSEGNLSFRHFKRAFPHLIIKNGELDVRISVFDKIGYYFNLVFGAILVLFGVLLLIMSMYVVAIDLAQFFILFISSIFFLLFSVFMIVQIAPVISARYVEEEVKKLKRI
jgi:hypothetical protein